MVNREELSKLVDTGYLGRQFSEIFNLQDKATAPSRGRRC